MISVKLQVVVLILIQASSAPPAIQMMTVFLIFALHLWVAYKLLKSTSISQPPLDMISN
jgi:hypothetical protein